jgi:uncharacterized heparinase superfamily protein
MAPLAALPSLPDDVLWPEGLDAVERRAADFARGRFVYLNREADFSGGIRWRDEGASPLWTYQLQYLGCVADLARTGRVADAARILAAWRDEFGKRWDAAAWHPYPASLRLVNLCVAASAAGGFEKLGDGVHELAALHAAFVLRHVERDVRGNHILENARALLWASRTFARGAAGECERTARTILETEIEEQVLPDGGHFELSPMYHCIVMRDLLEIRALLGDGDPLVETHVAPALDRMGDFLAGVLCPDGDIPLLGDSVRNFGPPPKELLRLVGKEPAVFEGVRSFPDTGLHVLRNARIWAIFDAGPVCPDYLPAHGQADTLTIEVWVDGVCVIADPGVFDYSGPERQWGRSSEAHSTVTFGRDTSEVYDSFRIGGRAEVNLVDVSPQTRRIAARMRPFGMRGVLSRTVQLADGVLTIEDGSTLELALFQSSMHLAPGAWVFERDEYGVVAATSRAARIEGVGAKAQPGRVSREFGMLETTTILRSPGVGGEDEAGATWTVRPL